MFEKFPLDKRGALGAARVLGLAVRAAVRIGIRNVEDASQQGAESPALRRLGRGQRQRTHRTAVEGAVERDDFVAARVIARQFDGRLHRFGAGVAEVNALRLGAGRDGGKFLGQLGQTGVVKIGPRHVNQFRRLFLDGGDDLRVAVAGGDDSDAGAEIKKGIAVNVFHDGAAASACD